MTIENNRRGIYILPLIPDPNRERLTNRLHNTPLLLWVQAASDVEIPQSHITTPPGGKLIIDDAIVRRGERILLTAQKTTCNGIVTLGSITKTWILAEFGTVMIRVSHNSIHVFVFVDRGPRIRHQRYCRCFAGDMQGHMHTCMCICSRQTVEVCSSFKKMVNLSVYLVGCCKRCKVDYRRCRLSRLR